MKKSTLLLNIAAMLLILCGYSGFAQVPPYYNGVNVNQTGEPLKDDLSVLITNTHTTFLTYTPGVWDALQQTDLDPTNPNNVLLIYGYDDSDNNHVTDRTRSKDSNGGNTGDWNREHTFPRSLGSPNLGSSGPGADAHHLRSSDVNMNSNRGNSRFADGSGNAGNVSGGWYPGDEWKGDVARMMMYMYLRYGSQCLPSAVGTGTQNYNADMMDIFLEWNAEDPVSAYEINRNVLLESIQGNRNPFIDNPAFATSIWGGPQAEDRFNSGGGDTEAPTAPSSLSAQNTTQTTTDLSWTASTDNVGVIAYQIFNGSTQVTATSNTNFTVTNLTPNTSYTFSVRAIDAAGNASPNSNVVNVTTLEDTTPPTGSAIVFQGFEGTSNDTWNYTNSPVNCTNGSDVWDIVTSVGSIGSANTDSNFFGVQDLDGNCGSADGGTIAFESVDISNYTDVTLSFAINVVGYDVANGDVISYEVFQDGTSQGVVTITDASPYSTNGWVNIEETIPDTVNSVSFTISVKQNGGSDYAGFDDVQLQGNETATTPDIIINEVDADTPGTDTQEFVELYDGGTGNTSLDGFVLVFYNGSNNQSYAAYDLDGQTTNAEGYFVIGNPDVPNVSSITFNSNGLQNGADAVALYLGDATDFPNNSTISTDNLVDAFVYDTNDGDDADLLVLLNAGQEQINEGGAGNKDEHSSQRIPNGSGGARNTSSYAQLAPTPGAKNEEATIPVNIVINEVDADTPGTDTQEFVELYDGGVGNSSLDGYVLVFYNGSNNQSYAAYDLDGQSTNANGYFVIGNPDVPNVSSITFNSNGLQNGADAVALYQGDATDFPNNAAITTDNLVDAFVYDTNDGDDAELLVLLNAGQEQINEGGAGNKDEHSSQRIPNGSGGARNTNTYAQLIPTPGEENMAPVAPSSIVINEVDADTPGTDTQEFVELYDGGAGNTSLDGYVLVFYNGSNNQSYAAYDLDGQTTSADGYFVIGNPDVPNVSSITFNSNGLQNGADAVALYQGDATDFPNNSAISTDNLVDAFVYDTNDGDDAELLVLLNSGQAQINEGGAGDKDNHSSQRFANGTGGARNTDTYVQALPTPGAVNSNATEEINLIINEIDADTAGSDTLEFIELYDGGAGNTSLDGFTIVLYNGSIDQSYAAYDLDGQTTNAEGYFVLGNTDVANVNMILPNNGLQNGADAVALYQGDATDFPNNSAITTNNLIDALVYDTNDSDDAELLVLLNAGQAQINEGELGNKDGHSIQRIPNGQGGARNTSTYTQADPTPGTENGAEPPTPDVIVISEARAKADGETVTVSGVLTVSDQFSGSAYIQDSTGGIAIFDELVHGDGVFMIGDSITVTGTRSSFNDQIQISPVTEVTNNGTPSNPITPQTITLSQLSEYPGQLVRITNPAFPAPGDILFGNSNYTLTDTSGMGEIRIDIDVESIVGLGQPESCNEVVGVIGRFRDTYQILPRIREDLACASAYEVPDIFVEVDKSKALDIVTWNIEWFGDEENSPSAGDPNSDAIQKERVKSTIQALNADIIAVQEIVDVPLFTEMVNELPNYEFILSDATSYPNDTTGAKQRIGFIYNSATVNITSSKVLLESIHPYYNGGDDSALVDYPVADKTRFYASGRLPFMITANVTVNGNTQEFNVVNLHARANSGNGAQDRYNMRKFDVEVLKDTLDASYSDKNIILLGDYNDDVDVTVADVTTTTSTYDAFVQDTDNYSIVSSSLSDLGFRSFVFRENMIDHITLSNELTEEHIATSERVHYEFYNATYTNTASDHFPVSTQLLLKALTVDSLTTTNATCNGNQDGTVTVNVSGGCAPYIYTWSSGTSTEENTISDLAAGTYTVTVTDALGITVTETFVITENEPLTAVLSEEQTIYFGYEDNSCATINVVEVQGGTAPYTYNWSNGVTTANNTVCPTETTTYSVEITDANGCTVTAETTVNVIDVRCGKKLNRVEMCFGGRTICVPKYFVNFYLCYGATLGSCDPNTNEFYFTQFRVFPNPFARDSYVKMRGTTDQSVKLIVYNFRGTKVFEKDVDLVNGRARATLRLSHLKRGLYYLQAVVDGEVKRRKTLFKYR